MEFQKPSGHKEPEMFHLGFTLKWPRNRPPAEDQPGLQP